MKTSILIVTVLISFTVCGQHFQLRKGVDSIVLEIDKMPGKIISFTKSAENKMPRIKYKVKYAKGNFAYIIRQYSNKDSSVEQVFYSKNSLLIFSGESITYYFGKDSIGWGGAYYFYNGKLQDHETGHGKSEHDNWDPELEVFGNYKRAKKDISKHLLTKNGS